MRIRVADRTYGECNIEVKNEISKSEEYTIKSLCMLQLLCMRGSSGEDRFSEFIAIIRSAVDQIDKLYDEESEEKSDTNDADPTSHLGY